MHKLVCGALALAALSVSAHANEDDWLALDHEIEALSTSLNRQSTGPVLGGWLFSSFRWSQDTLGFSGIAQTNNPAVPTRSLQGFQLDTARLFVEGNHHHYGYKVSADFIQPNGLGQHGSGFNLLDAYMTWRAGDVVNLTIGQFRQPFLRSGLVDQNKQMFFSDFSALGEAFMTRTPGLMLDFSWSTVDLYLALQNDLQGTGDGTGSNFMGTGRIQFNLMGGGVPLQQSAYALDPATKLSLGLAIANEGGHNKGTFGTADATLTSGPFYLEGELTNFGDGSGVPASFGSFWNPLPGTPIGYSTSSVGFGTAEVGGTTPWLVGIGYMITPDEYEIVARWEDADNGNQDKLLRVGLNRHTKGGAVRFYLGYEHFDTQAPGSTGRADADTITVGMGINF